MSSTIKENAPANVTPDRITTVEQLRAILGEPSPTTRMKLWTRLEPPAIEFISRSPFLLLRTADAAGFQDVSPKGDGPGFVAVENENTLLIPDRKGNKLLFGLQNILANPQVGIVFLIPGTGETLRVNGTAELTAAPATLARLRRARAVGAGRDPGDRARVFFPLRQGFPSVAAVEPRELDERLPRLVRQDDGAEAWW